MNTKRRIGLSWIIFCCLLSTGKFSTFFVQSPGKPIKFPDKKAVIENNDEDVNHSVVYWIHCSAAMLNFSTGKRKADQKSKTTTGSDILTK